MLSQCMLLRKVGRQKRRKQIYILLGKVLKDAGENEKLIVCGDMKGHVEVAADGFDGVHGGKGFGIRKNLVVKSVLLKKLSKNCVLALKCDRDDYL